MKHRRKITGRQLWQRVSVVAGVATVLLAVTWPVAAASATSRAVGPSAASRPPRNLLTQDFPDPGVLKAGNRYYSYSTNSGGVLVPWASADSADGPWKVQSGSALGSLPGWADTANAEVLAPEVTRIGDHFVMYYSAKLATEDGRFCIGAATAPAPGQVFAPVPGDPLICNDRGIDPSPVVDGDARYVVYQGVIDGGEGILSQQVSADGLHPVGDSVPLLGADPTNTGPTPGCDHRDQPWPERGIVEGPSLVHHGGSYVLFYSAGEFWNDSYHIGFAVSSSLTGVYKKPPIPLLTSCSFNSAVTGPGGQSRVAEPSGDHLFFHGITSEPGKDLTRGLFVADLGWHNDIPVVLGDSTTK